MAESGTFPLAGERHLPTRAGVAAYLLLVLGGIGLFLLVKTLGADLEAPSTNAAPGEVESAAVVAKPNIVFHVIATLAAVLAVGHSLGRLLMLIGQPPVIGEVLAGILLGPSLLGAISPAAMHLLIPSREADPHGQVPAALKAVSQFGVILFMFLVGLKLNSIHLKKQAHAAMAVAHASIVVPFVLGSALALGLYPIYSNASVPFTSFALFIGAAMAVTAFPVLARILSDRGMENSRLGTIALGCAAADDVTAWCLLAVVVGIARSEVSQAMGVVTAALAFIAFMFLLVKPFLAKLCRKLDARPGPLPPVAVSGTFLALLLCSLATEGIGIHAVFGAFLLGAVLPHNSKIATEFTAKLKDLVTVLLLPAFFAYTGMRMQIGLVSGATDWFWCAAIILVATAGKFGGASAAARLTGMNWRDSASLGALMNTRGLMGLVVLNIGLDLEILSPKLFAMMVLMALVTTAATAPLLGVFYRGEPVK